MELTVEVHHEDQGYWAEVSELEGCLTDARTLKELAVYLEEVIQMCLDDESARLLDPELHVGTVRVQIGRAGD
jgi:predicted RNase H-like HicB family nuclease